ncbi:MAG: hypothetical protein QOC82_2304 [Frankiaceae bacterium]|nr:hypothetical protein [Frankiaceae bacterium]
MTLVSDAQEAVELVTAEAVLAAIQGTFAVGGAIIDRNGYVVQAMHNNVLEPYPGSTAGFNLHDPTAHGERQLVDWYFAQPPGLPLPPDLTVVTTLDPCAMCAGALLTAGFNVAVAAIDTFAGINYSSDFSFPTLPPALRAQAQATFGYYGVQPPMTRPYVGANTPQFAGESIDTAALELADLVFTNSVGQVRSASNASGLDPSKMSDPANLPPGDPVRIALTNLYAETLTVRSANPRFPGPEIGAPLVSVAKAAAGRGAALNAVALLDPFGNLLSCLGGAEQSSPIRTAFLELTRDYALLRWTLMNSPDERIRNTADATLTHPKYCTFVELYGPDPATPQAVMTFGAYGSTMEGPIPRVFPSSFQYVLTPAGTTDEAIAQLAFVLPPFYVKADIGVGVSPQRVLNQALVDAVASTEPAPAPPRGPRGASTD